MIIRILSEGQFRVDESALAELNIADDQVQAALQAGDQRALASALAQLHEQIRAGEPVPDEEIVDSDLIIPDAAASLAEVQALLDDTGSHDGLIPG